MKFTVSLTMFWAGLANAQPPVEIANEDVTIDGPSSDPSLLPEADIDPPGVVRVLANVSVGPHLRTYSSRVRNCGDDLTHVKLRVTQAALYVDGAGVSFADGTSRSYDIARTFHSGYESPWIDVSLLRPGDTCVTAVNVRARAASAGETSNVEVFGNFTN